jgi:hypothetical protein
VGGGMGGRRDGFSSLVKQTKQGKKCAVFCFAGKKKYYLFIYEVITWGKRKKARLLMMMLFIGT